MAKSLNEVLLMGNLTKDPELKEFDSGRNKVRFSLALNRSYKDQNDQWQEATDYVDCVAWGRLADQVMKSTGKGSKVLVSGRIQTSTWENEGIKQYRTEVLAEDVTFVGKVLSVDTVEL